MKICSSEKRIWAAVITGMVLVTLLVPIEMRAETEKAPSGDSPGVANPPTSREEKELWAELYFSALTAATLTEGKASAVPATVEALEKSPYLVWKPALSYPVKDAGQKWNIAGMVSRRRILEIQSEILRKKHTGMVSLERGEILIAISEEEILFAAGIAGVRDQVEMYGPRTFYVRRNPEGARFYIYRQVHRAVRAYRAGGKSLPADLKALSEFVGVVNPECERKYDLKTMFQEAVREVSSR